MRCVTLLHNASLLSHKVYVSWRRVCIGEIIGTWRISSKQALQVTTFEQVELKQAQYLLHAKAEPAHELDIGK